MLLQITFLGDKLPLEVDPGITVGQLKQLIQGMKEGLTGTLKLVANGINFSNDLLTLNAIGLQSGASIIVLVTKPDSMMEVLLKNEKGQTKPYDVALDETVSDFKKKVYNKERVPVDQQRLIYEGKQLDDGRKLKDYSIVSGSTIYLTLRLRGG